MANVPGRDVVTPQPIKISYTSGAPKDATCSTGKGGCIRCAPLHVLVDCASEAANGHEVTKPLIGGIRWRWLHGTKPCTAVCKQSVSSPATKKPNLVSWAKLLILLAPRPGLEPGTYGLTVRLK